MRDTLHSSKLQNFDYVAMIHRSAYIFLIDQDVPDEEGIDEDLSKERPTNNYIQTFNSIHALIATNVPSLFGIILKRMV